MRLSAADLRKRLTETVLEMANLVRRVVLTSSSGGQWGIEGYKTEDGIEGDEDEPVDVFQGLYIYARPGADDNAEAVMLSVGAKSNNPVIAAVRNEDARRRYVEEFGDIAQGEIVIFNSLGKSRIHISAAGAIAIEAESGQEVLIRSPGGATDALVKKSEFDGHSHTTTATVSSGSVGVIGGAPAVTGTEVLKAE